MRVIEGRKLDQSSVTACKNNGCSLIVKDNDFKTISFPNLTEISNGDVVFGDNPNLCYFFPTIDWRGILTSEGDSTNVAHWLDSGKQPCKACSPVCHG